MTCTAHSDYLLVESGRQSMSPVLIMMNRMKYLPDATEFNYQRSVYQTTNELLTGECDISAKHPVNGKYLEQIQNVISTLPRLVNIEKSGLIIPEFDEIEELETDTPEIKKYLRKVNLEFVGYYCNHDVKNEKVNKCESNTVNITSSEEYKEYVEFMDDMARLVLDIRHRDRIQNKEFKDFYKLPQSKKVEKMMSNVIKLNGEILKSNATTCPTCSRCKATSKKYDYVLKTVQRMREEAEEMRRIREEPIRESDKTPRGSPGATGPSILEFINKHFEGIDRFTVGEVQKSFKNIYNVTITQDKIKEEVSANNGFKITKPHGTLTITKL